MSRIIEYPKVVEERLYFHEYRWRQDASSGFSFEVDRNGNLVRPYPETCENLRRCLSGEYDVVDFGIKERVQAWKEPAVLRCDCGDKVYLTGFTNTCDRCNRDYNMSGQLLAPRSFWGEETGEHIVDILNIK